MTLTALLELTLTPQSLADAPEVLRETLQDTRAFPGCLGVEVLRSRQEPTRVLLIERWESAEADAAYRVWRATPQGASRLKTLLAGPPSLTTFTTESDI